MELRLRGSISLSMMQVEVKLIHIHCLQINKSKVNIMKSQLKSNKPMIL